ncbi:hypothetical protein J2S09_000547 [Bacillus fengqiuensis]|nr:hypothetical protein [Bacillus fengqiuensis]
MMINHQTEIEPYDVVCLNPVSVWRKIEGFLEEQTTLFYKVMERNAHSSSYSNDHKEMKIRYEKAYNRLINYIEVGVETGEFDPQYSVSLCVDMLVTTLEGLRFVCSNGIYENKQIVAEQMKLIRQQLKDTLLVI